MTTAYEKEYFAHDMDELIDLLLRAEGLRKAFLTRGSKVWIDRVDDDFLEMRKILSRYL